MAHLLWISPFKHGDDWQKRGGALQRLHLSVGGRTKQLEVVLLAAGRRTRWVFSFANDLEAIRVAGQMGFNAAGELASRMGWQEGSKEKVALHAAVGAAVAALGGGNAINGLASAAATQAALPYVIEALERSNIDPHSRQGSVLVQAASLAVGAAVDGGNDAGTALAATVNNFLSHPEWKEMKEAEAACARGSAAACEKKTQLHELSESRNENLLMTCGRKTNPACTVELSKAAAAAETWVLGLSAKDVEYLIQQSSSNAKRRGAPRI